VGKDDFVPRIDHPYNLFSRHPDIFHLFSRGPALSSLQDRVSSECDDDTFSQRNSSRQEDKLISLSSYILPGTLPDVQKSKKGPASLPGRPF
jgi:hypothetical protein